MPRAEKHSPIQAVLLAFQDSGKPYIALRTDTHKNAYIAQAVYKAAAKRCGIQIRTMVKNGKLYLIRIKPGEETDGRKWRNTGKEKRAGTVGGDT